MKVYVNIKDKRWKKYDIDFEKIANAAVSGVYKDSEVSITLINNREIRKINKKYRGIDKPTNVLSFELGDDLLLGDIFIALDTVIDEAAQAGISVQEHTAHMVVHGVLHLLGYDHIKDKDAKKMESKEIAILKKLGYKNPYQDTTDVKVCTSRDCCPGEKTLGRFRGFFAGNFGQFLLFAFCGAISSLGFAPFNMWWFTILGIGGAYMLSIKYLAGKRFGRRFLFAASFGAFYAISMFWWVLHSIYVVPELTQEFAIWTVPGLIGIGIVGAIIFSIPFIAISSIRQNPAARPFLFASVWTLVLWFREWLFTGFPWNPIANISLVNIYVANSMSLFGAIGLTFVIIGLIAAICEIIKTKTNATWVSFLIFLFFGIVGVLYGVKNINYVNKSSDVNSPLIRIVQPAQSAVQKATHSRKAALQNAQYNLQNMVNLATAEGEYDLLVFPETSYPFVVVPGDVIEIGRIIGHPTVVGANYFANNNLYNSMLIVDDKGRVSHVYSKSHLVPFGEYRPFGDLVPTPGLLTPGTGAEVVSVSLKNSEFKFAPAICYEIIFSDSLIEHGKTPEAIVNITNDNWFGKTPGTYQHLDMVRRYAIESGVPIVRANYSGISAFISADGRISAEIPVGQAGHVDGTIAGAHKTAYRAIGRDNMMIIILLIACLCSVWMHQIYRPEN